MPDFATGGIVQNRYAEPQPRACPYPCLMHGEDWGHCCPSHAGCCRQTYGFLRAAPSPESCSGSITYYLYKDPILWEMEARAQVTPFQNATGEPAWSATLRGDFLRVSSELADLRQRQQGLGRQLHSDGSDYADVMRCCVGEDLGLVEGRYWDAMARPSQFAHTWDANHLKGLCTPRPGRHAEFGAGGVSDLRAVSPMTSRGRPSAIDVHLEIGDAPSGTDTLEGHPKNTRLFSSWPMEPPPT